MKHKKRITVPASESEIIEKTTCDICNKNLDELESRFDVDEVTIKHRQGRNYHDNGSGTEMLVDMCGECFNTKLIPFLKIMGCDPVEEEWDW